MDYLPLELHAPQDPGTLDVWDTVMKWQTVPGLMLKGIPQKRGKQHWYLRKGPWSKSKSTLQMYYWQSIIYPFLARQGDWVINTFSNDEIEYLLAQTQRADLKWQPILESIDGLINPGMHRVMVVHAYMYCKVSKDAFGFEKRLKDLAAEVFYAEYDMGLNHLDYQAEELIKKYAHTDKLKLILELARLA